MVQVPTDAIPFENILVYGLSVVSLENILVLVLACTWDSEIRDMKTEGFDLCGFNLVHMESMWKYKAGVFFFWCLHHIDSVLYSSHTHTHIWMVTFIRKELSSTRDSTGKQATTIAKKKRKTKKQNKIPRARPQTPKESIPQGVTSYLQEATACLRFLSISTFHILKFLAVSYASFIGLLDSWWKEYWVLGLGEYCFLWKNWNESSLNWLYGKYNDILHLSGFWCLYRLEEDKEVAGLFEELWEEIASSERVTLQLYLNEIVSLLCDEIMSSSWASKKKVSLEFFNLLFM